MDGLFTVFGLGIAVGVFFSWVYDVIRKRNTPVDRGASFSAFHGADVLPAAEPVSGRSVQGAEAEEETLHFAPLEPVVEPAQQVVVMDPTPVFESSMEPAHSLPVDFGVAEVEFKADEQGGPADFTAPSAPVAGVAPRVVLLVNDTLVREVQESDLAALMAEYGIMEGSEEAMSFQSGNPVLIGKNNVQLTQV